MIVDEPGDHGSPVQVNHTRTRPGSTVAHVYEPLIRDAHRRDDRKVSVHGVNAAVDELQVGVVEAVLGISRSARCKPENGTDFEQPPGARNSIRQNSHAHQQIP